MHAYPYDYDDLIRSIPLANPTDSVYIPDHYRTYFPEDNSLIAPNVYVLSFSYISGGSILYKYVGTLALLTPHGTHYAGSPLMPSTSLVYHARLTHGLTNPKPYLDSNAQSTPNAAPPLFEHPSTTIDLMISKRSTKLFLALPILP
ncbi:hypothetical protein PIB30_073856 [Stylosanthes scabra]|uniref:Uncharacterized protein n=1 Tax=Stylosanthes scabra TaxID=79078 RepID=A0ABU6ZN94_9FABA|nr:hypothetical protein [Stylosanthes scabra]